MIRILSEKALQVRYGHHLSFLAKKNAGKVYGRPMQAKAINGQRFSLVFHLNESCWNIRIAVTYTSRQNTIQQKTTPNVFRDGSDIVGMIPNFGIGKSHDPDVLGNPDLCSAVGGLR